MADRFLIPDASPALAQLARTLPLNHRQSPFTQIHFASGKVIIAPSINVGHRPSRCRGRHPSRCGESRVRNRDQGSRNLPGAVGGCSRSR
jgi:hypothetical protein